ncbi:MAG TPA: IS4 family transposase [Micromonosporaceae bacterium]|nr:IS4 family transposase [Micromonosporaceae bacterium]
MRWTRRWPGSGWGQAFGTLPAHVVAYLTMALCLFAEDDYEEVATKVMGALTRFGCWDASWSVPTSSGITQARQRVGAAVMAEIFESVVQPVGTAETRGAWLRRRRVLAVDGFDVDLPDTPSNAAEFGYAGSGANRSAYPKARVVALAECGTHAFLACEVSGYGVGEQTLAARLYPRLRVDELLTADRGFYSFQAWSTAAATGAALLWRAPTGLRLPVVAVLTDGTYTSVVMDAKIRSRRRERILAAAHAGQPLDPQEAHLVRVVEYDVPDRAGNGTGELVVLLTTITDPADARADEGAGDRS